jgi:hypothetical protein
METIKKAKFENEVLDVQDYLELITNNLEEIYGVIELPSYSEIETLEELENFLQELYEINDISIWNYPINEVDVIIENEISVVLVRFKDLCGGYEYRWCELPEQFYDDED